MNVKQPYALSFSTLLVLLAVAWSCSSSKSDQEKNAAEFEAASGSVKEELSQLIRQIPSPSDIPYMIQATGADYNESLINPVTNADKYNRTDKQALNLGVYAADIGYLTSYDKTQQAIDYLNSCKSMADNLGIVGSFDIEVLKRFEENISNKDSIKMLLNNAVEQSQNYLQDESRNKLAALVVAGSFVEGLYVSTGLVNTYPKDLLPADTRNLVLTPVIQIILNQEASVSNLLKALTAVEQTGPVAGMVSDLQELEKAYAALNIEEQLKNNQGSQVLSDANLVQISEIVSRMRTSIIE
jgi:hypothetical protein